MVVGQEGGGHLGRDDIGTMVLVRKLSMLFQFLLLLLVGLEMGVDGWQHMRLGRKELKWERGSLQRKNVSMLHRNINSAPSN